MSRQIIPDLVWEVGAQLGEGPIWLQHEAALRFVDIKRGLLHRYHPASGAHQTLHVGGKPSFIVPEANGGLLVGSEHGVYALDGDRLARQVAVIPQSPTNRTNDATVGADGRLWLGTMDDNERARSGAIWCLDRGALHLAGGDAVVTNGPAISGDGRLLYAVDSGGRTIRRYALSGGCQLGEGDVFLQLSPDDGYPDGIVIDSEDCLWVALWDGWGVRRYSPDGSMMLHVDFPCARVTKVAFGGPDLTTAYVTTARTGLSDDELTRQPLAGSLFQFEAPAAGRVLPAVVLA